MLKPNLAYTVTSFVNNISIYGRNTSGVKLMNIEQDSDIRVASIAKVRENKDDGDEEEEDSGSSDEETEENE